jgi:hypothetical protein
MQGEEVGGDTEADPVAEVEAEMEAAGVALEEEVSPPGTAAESGKPPTDKPLPIADRLSRLRKEIAQDETHEQVAGPEPEASAADIEVEAEPVEDTGAGDTAIAALPAEPGGPEPVAEMAAEMETADEAGDDQPAPIEPPEVAEELAGEQSTAESTIEEDRPADEGQPADEASQPPAERSSGPTDTTAAMFVDPKLATFTLVDIYKVQGLYQQALQALDILENKGGDPERIERERTTNSAAMSAGSKSE